MPSISSHFPIFRVGYLGILDEHHAIYMAGRGEQDGLLAHVRGSIHQGMTVHYEENARHPESSPSFQWIQQVGWVSHEHAARVTAICDTVPPPGKQYHLSKCLVPRDKIRHCQHWVTEALDAMRDCGVMEALGDGDCGEIVGLAQ